jgi:hypothetical protein
VEGFSYISTVGGNKIIRKSDVGVLVNDEKDLPYSG